MNLTPAGIARSGIQLSGRPDPKLRRLPLPGVCLAGAAGDRLDIQRRLAAETDTGKLRRSRPRHHHHDATDEPTTTANHRHRS